MPWLLLNLGAIPHGASGGDSSPVPSSPAPPVQLSASNRVAPALFTPPGSAPAESPPTLPPGVNDELLRAAWEGQTTACYQLGKAWHDLDPVKAANWYRVAAAQGYALAQANLGILYERYQVAPNAAQLVGEGNLTLPAGRKMKREDATFFEQNDLLRDR